MGPPIYTKDWFTNNLPLWEKMLAKYASRPVLWLEVGSYEGRSAIWALDNILKHPKSHIWCVDSFISKTYDTFRDNMKPYKGRFTLLKGKSEDMLKKQELLDLKGKFDIIYIDADRHGRHVLEDAVLCYPLLKPDGLLIFDDYTYSREHDSRCPKMGIEAFCNTYAHEIKVIVTRWQLIVKRRKKPLVKKKCFSEFWS